MRQYKNICTKENFEAEFLYLKLATLIYNKFLGWYDSYDQLCELLAEEGKYAIVGNTLTDAVVYEKTSSCWESTGVLFFQKFIDDFVSSDITLTDELKRTICVLIGASYGPGEESGSSGTIDIEKYLKEVGKYLKAGNHISITNNTISCLLEPGDGIAINNNKISCTDTKVFEIVDELPTSNIKDDKIYLLDEGSGKFSQYVYSGGGWNNITPKAEVVIPDGSGGSITKELILQLLGFDRNNNTLYLRKDGQWVTPPDTNTTYNNATQSEAGLMSALDKKKLDTLLNVTAASLLDYGSDTTKYLRNDGKWTTPPDTKYSTATTTTPGLMSSADKLKLDSLSISNDDEEEDEGGNQNVPRDSVLYTCNPYTYIKVILKGDIGGQLLAQRGGYKWPTNTTNRSINGATSTVVVSIPEYESYLALENSGDVYEGLIESKPFHIINGEDVASYDLLKYKDGLPYLYLGKYDSDGNDLGLEDNEIILIDGENSQTIANSTYNKQYPVNAFGTVISPKKTHILLPVLDGGAHTITYVGGTTLLEAATSVSRSYMAMDTTTEYEDRLPSRNGERESLEGYVLTADADQTQDITFYVIHEQVDTYSGTLPKEIMFKGTYHMMNKMEVDTVGPVDGIPIVGTYYIGGPRLQKYNPDSGLWIQYPCGDIENTTITMVNNEAQIITNSNSKTITLNPTSNIVSSATDNTRTYTGSIINTDGINKISYKVIYKVDIKAESIPSDAFDDYSVIHMGINNPISGVTSQLVKATAIEDVIE